MANTFPIISTAKVLVKSSVAVTVPEGRGVVFTGTLGADGVPLISAPSGADGVIHGVTYEADIDDANAGYILLRGLSPVRLRIGSVGVTKGDSLRIKNNTGVWETAPAGSQNAYYEALQTVAANGVCYALPIASKAI
jgi:hypothetical protein